MHQLVPILATAHETSKTAFYVIGGLLAAWAIGLALFGMSRPEFPGSVAAQRGIIAITAVLVVGAMASAIGTASTPAGVPHYTKVINGGRPGGMAPPGTVTVP